MALAKLCTTFAPFLQLEIWPARQWPNANRQLAGRMAIRAMMPKFDSSNLRRLTHARTSKTHRRPSERVSSFVHPLIRPGAPSRSDFAHANGRLSVWRAPVAGRLVGSVPGSLESRPLGFCVARDGRRKLAPIAQPLRRLVVLRWRSTGAGRHKSRPSVPAGLARGCAAGPWGSWAGRHLRRWLIGRRVGARPVAHARAGRVCSCRLGGDLLAAAVRGQAALAPASSGAKAAQIGLCTSAPNR